MLVSTSTTVSQDLYHINTKYAFKRYVQWALDIKLILQNFIQKVLIITYFFAKFHIFLEKI